MRRALLTVLGVLMLAAFIGAGVYTIVWDGHHAVKVAPTKTTVGVSRPRPRSPRPPAAGGTARQRMTLRQVLGGFADGYAAFLTGSSPTRMRRFGSVTSASQAVQAGRIPVSFRDGPVTIVARGHLSRSCCSAQESVVLGDRQERYPFIADLLYEGNEWIVSQIEPVDLSMDRHTHPERATHVPTQLRAAATRFARSYLAYREGIRHELPEPATAGAEKAIREGIDTLADTTLPAAQPKVTAVSFGPPSSGEVAATVTVKDGVQQETFSLLMTDRHGHWKAAAFL